MTTRPEISGVLFTAVAAAICAGTIASNSFGQSPPVYQPRPTTPVRTEPVAWQFPENQQSDAETAESGTETTGTTNTNGYPNRYPYLITRPADREWIRSIPIEKRPNRFFHVYGNAVRAGVLPHGPIGKAIFGN
jgi:hypothetical protein